jgi:hypothetical protein
MISDSVGRRNDSRPRRAHRPGLHRKHISSGLTAPRDAEVTTMTMDF